MESLNLDAVMASIWRKTALSASSKDVVSLQSGLRQPPVRPV